MDAGAGISLGMAWIVHWWQELSTAWKWIFGSSLTAAVGAIVKGWHWLTGKWDAPVLGFLEDRAECARKEARGNVVAMNAPVEDIAVAVDRPRNSVLRSLQRLKRQKKVLDHNDGWSLFRGETRRENISRFSSRFEG